MPWAPGDNTPTVMETCAYSTFEKIDGMAVLLDGFALAILGGIVADLLFAPWGLSLPWRASPIWGVGGEAFVGSARSCFGRKRGGAFLDRQIPPGSRLLYLC